MDKNNVLFVGNGIDLLNGYKTDYISFLISKKEYYQYLYVKEIENMLDSKVFYVADMMKEEKLDVFEFIQSACIKKNEHEIDTMIAKYEMYDRERFEANTHKNRTISSILEPKTNAQLLMKEVSKLSLSPNNKFFNVANLTLENINSCIRPNIWISYFMCCSVKGILSGENWIDLEGLIFMNAKKNSEKLILEYTIEEHKEKYYNSDCDIHSQFDEMKKILSEYLSNATSCEGKLKNLRCSELSKYGTVLNFNYSSSNLLMNTEPAREEICIHGKIEDGKKIVFGYDDGMLSDVNTHEYDCREGYERMSKTYQLLDLSLNYQLNRMNVEKKLPSRDNILHIGILGHSIGDADYNYFSTLCNFDNVIIEVFWYNFLSNGDNHTSLKNNLFKYDT